MNRHSIDFLKKELHYSPTTGIFKWKTDKTGVGRYSRFKGQEAGKLNKSNGYIQIAIQQRTYQCHVLAHAFMTGKWPTHQIDHFDRVRHNNKWSNLFEVTKSQNQRNRNVSKANKTGYPSIRHKYTNKDGTKKYEAFLHLEDGSRLTLPSSADIKSLYIDYARIALNNLYTLDHVAPTPKLKRLLRSAGLIK